jgi:hypothetical protein
MNASLIESAMNVLILVCILCKASSDKVVQSRDWRHGICTVPCIQCLMRIVSCIVKLIRILGGRTPHQRNTQLRHHMIIVGVHRDIEHNTSETLLQLPRIAFQPKPDRQTVL